MATIDLGKIKQVWRGTYNNSTAYTVDDLVEYTDSGITSTYICVANSTGNAPSSGGTAHANWNYVAKGVADPIPSQSGQDGKFLKTNGAALSFDEVSTDVVKLGSTGSMSGTSLSFDNYYSSTYDLYKIYIFGLYQSSGASVKFRFLNSSGGTHTGNNYLGGRIDEGYETNDSNYYSAGGHRNVNDDCVTLQDTLAFSDTYESNIEMTIWRPLTQKVPTMFWHAQFWDGTTWAEHSYGRASTRDNMTTRGGNISSSQTLYLAKMVIYGMKM